MANKLLQEWLKASNGDPTVLLLGLGNSASFSQRINGFYPHMVVPEILGEEGLLGIGLFCSAVWMAIYTMRRGYRLSIGEPVQRGGIQAKTSTIGIRGEPQFPVKPRRVTQEEP